VWAELTSFSVAPSAAVSEYATMILNSPYDPDSALGGTQPVGFAKLMTFYSKCFVLGAVVQAELTSTGSTDGGADTTSIVSTLGVTTNTTVITNLTYGIGDGMFTYKMVNVNPDVATLGISVDISKFVSKPDILDDPQFFCTSAANPSQVIVGHFGVQSFGAVATGYVTSLLTIEFDCVFTDPIPFT